MTLPTYPWFDQVPDHLKTRNQLAEQGLRPGGPVVAQVVWRGGKRWADLYDVGAAKPKQAMTEAQKAALDKAQEARRTCPHCRHVFTFVLPDGFDCPVCFEQILARDHQAAARAARIWLRSHRTIILDTETTSLDGYLVQIAIIQAHDGQVVLDTLVNPQTDVSPGARSIHGITDAELATAPTFTALSDRVLRLLRGRRVVTYNADFDANTLYNEVARLTGYRTAETWRRSVRWRCAMELYAQWYGDWSDRHQSYRWQPLAGGDHSALGDARACRAVLQRMATEQEATNGARS